MLEANAPAFNSRPISGRISSSSMEKPDTGKINKTRGLQSEVPLWVHAAGGLFAFALLVMAAVYGVSVVQADAIFPQYGPPPTVRVTMPQFVLTPGFPHVRRAAESSAVDPMDPAAPAFRGIASWYGSTFDGRLTASGRVYNMYAMTAATSELHTTLPLGTMVRVVNSRNGRSVVVHITDRGPLPKGRIIDLSYGAARKLKMVKAGVAHVRVQVLHWGSNRYHSEAG